MKLAAIGGTSAPRVCHPVPLAAATPWFIGLKNTAAAEVVLEANDLQGAGRIIVEGNTYIQLPD